MDSFTRLARRAALVLPVLALAGCASMRVNSFTDRSVDLRQYRTYDWAPVSQLSTGDPRLDNNEFFDAQVRADVDRELAAKGLQRSTTNTPDLLVHYHASVSQEIDVRQIDRDYDYCENFDCRPYVYEAGTLFVDLVDPEDDRLVWRGWAEASMDGVIDDQALLDARIEDAVRRIVQRFPGRM